MVAKSSQYDPRGFVVAESSECPCSGHRGFVKRKLTLANRSTNRPFAHIGETTKVICPYAAKPESTTHAVVLFRDRG